MSQLLLGVGRGVAAVAAGGGFTPTSDATATHWWDASYTASHTGSGDTLSIADRIGSAALGTSPANGPSGTKTINGNNAFTFDGTERMFTGGIADLSSDTFHLFVVSEIGTVSGSGDSIVTVGATSTTTDVMELRANSSPDFLGRLAMNAVGATSFNLTGGPYTGLVLAEIVANVATGAIEVFIGGTSRGTATGFTGFTTATPSIMVMSGAQGLNEMGGSFCELVVCNAPRTGADLTAMRGYLNTKWGL